MPLRLRLHYHQAVIDDTSTEAGAIIELTEPESTDEAKSVTTELVFIGKPNGITDEGIGTLFEQALAEASAPGDNGYIAKESARVPRHIRVKRDHGDFRTTCYNSLQCRDVDYELSSPFLICRPP